MDTCTAHNGSYSCSLRAAHEGPHQTRPFNTVKGRRIATFSTMYSKVTFANTNR